MYPNDQKGLLADRPNSKTYSREQKLDAVQAHIRDGRTIAEVTASYGISDPSILKRWCHEYRETGCVSSSRRGRPAGKSRADDPAKRIRELEMQVDILKKYWNCKGGDNTGEQIQNHIRTYWQISRNGNVQILVRGAFLILLLDRQQ